VHFLLPGHTMMVLYARESCLLAGWVLEWCCRDSSEYRESGSSTSSRRLSLVSRVLSGRRK